MAAHASFAPALASIQQTFQQAAQAAPDLNGVLALWQAVRWQALLKEYEEKLHNLEAENKRLSQLVTDYESGRFMRCMAKLKQGRPARN